MEGQESAQWKCRRRSNRRRWHSIWRRARLLLCTKRIKQRSSFNKRLLKLIFKLLEKLLNCALIYHKYLFTQLQGKLGESKKASSNNIISNSLWNNYSNILSTKEWMMPIYLDCLLPPSPRICCERIMIFFGCPRTWATVWKNKDIVIDQIKMRIRALLKVQMMTDGKMKNDTFILILFIYF